MTFQTLIDVAELRPRLGTPRLAVVDCQFDLSDADAGRRAFREAHIPGARYADLNRDLSASVTPQSGRHPLPLPDAAASTFTHLGIGAGVQVVAYDAANGAFAARLWWLLRWLGHRDVAVLDGGFKAWLSAGAPTESGDPLPANAAGTGRHAPGSVDGLPPFMPRPDPCMVLETADVSAALTDATRLLVDARAPERFAGRVEPIDPVAGHVPGAVNHPFSSNLAADGRFLPPEELTRRWRARLGPVEPRNAIAMCGSGVTACHNLLALERAGLPGAKLYAGSWSEWIRDPARGVARDDCEDLPRGARG